PRTPLGEKRGDIVTIDATDPWGGGRLFPRGLLREPVAGLARARVAVLTRATSVTAARRREIRRQAEEACAGRAAPAWLEAEHRPLLVRAFSGTTRPLDWLAGRSVAAFAGIGNPAAFRESLAPLTGPLRGFRGFPDHHRYSDADLDSLGGWARETGADVILTTLKDLVKVRRDQLGALPVFAVEISLVVLGGDGLEAIGPLFDSLATRSVKEDTR
ncbi:MAG: tetraacyldisaccharide 4'-kinase, partial [Planctomycetia bacterium]